MSSLLNCGSLLLHRYEDSNSKEGEMPTENETKLGSTGGSTAVVDRLYRSSDSTAWYVGGSTAWHEIRAVLHDLAEIRSKILKFRGEFGKSVAREYVGG